MSKETKELLGFAATTINTGYKIAEDKKVNLEDLQHLLPLVFAGQEGVGGIGEVPGEQQSIGPAEKGEIRQEVAGKLAGINAVRADDWEDALMGVLSIYRLGQAAGAKDATEAIIKQLESGVSLDEIKAQVA